MEDIGLLRCVELLLEDRFNELKSSAQTDDQMRHAAEFGGARAYVRERIKKATELEAAIAPPQRPR